MRFHFTEEDEPTRVRAADMRAALAAHHHEVTHAGMRDAPPSDASVWLHGLGWNGTLPFAEPRGLSAFGGKIVLFQTCDHETMHFERIPAWLTARARLFLRNHWPADLSLVPEHARERLGFLPPMLRPFAPRRGRELAQRSIGSMFFGTRTGQHYRLADGRTPREATVAMMRSSGLPFEGGILPHTEPVYQGDPSLTVPKLSAREHARRLADARLCLAPWGNHPLSYRFFEGLACRCLVLAQSLRSARFIDGGLTPGVHYVEIAPDLSDLVEKARHYLAHLDEAQRIADAGHAQYARYLASSGRLPSEHCYTEAVRSWGALMPPVASPTPVSRLRALIARAAPTML